MSNFLDHRGKPITTRTLTAMHKRNYDAAKNNRLTADWRPVTINTNTLIYQTLSILRARSRNEVRNNDYAKRFLQLIDQNVIGSTGIKLAPSPRNRDGSPDVKASLIVSNAWIKWMRKENCDVANRQSLVGFEQLIMRSVATDGEVLIRKVKDKNASNYGGYALQFLDPSILDIKKNEKLKNGNRIVMGVEVNIYNRPIAYHLGIRDDNIALSDGQNFSRHIRVEADEIYHLFITEFPEQVRGIPWYATALLRMHMLNGYEDAAVTAARVGASKAGFFQSTQGADYDGEKAADGSVTMEVEPGVFEELPPGWEFIPYNPDYPHQQFPDFVKATLRGIAAGLGLSYFALASDLSDVNFSSARIGLLEDQSFYKSLQNFVIENFMEPVYEDWLVFALLTGKIVAPNGKKVSFSSHEKLSQVEWKGRRWSWLDPLKDSKAAQTDIKTGIKSRSQIIRDLGGDPDSVFAEIAVEQQKFKDLGIDFTDDGINDGVTEEETEETTTTKDEEQ